MRHLFEKHYGLCKFEQEYLYCSICSHNFFVCDQCGLYSGCLTTECCNYFVYPMMGVFVYHGVADYVNGSWVYPGTDYKIWNIYKELLQYVEVNEFEVYEMPRPSSFLPHYSKEP